MSLRVFLKTRSLFSCQIKDATARNRKHVSRNRTESRKEGKHVSNSLDYERKAIMAFASSFS